MILQFVDLLIEILVIVILVGIILFRFVPAFLLSLFIVFWDDRSQLLNKSILICLTAAFLSAVLGTFLAMLDVILLNAFFTIITNLFLPLILTLIFSVVFSFVFKAIIFKRISAGEIGELTKLEKNKILLQISDLKVYYPLRAGFLRRQIGAVKAVDGVSLNVKTGQTLGLVGESGCGKSTLAKAILGLVEVEAGEMRYQDELISKDKYPKELRKKIQIVYQDPDASLNPRKKVIDIVTEPLRNLYGIINKKELRNHALRLLNSVSLKREHLDRYPDEFSGGQKQRIVIARALACNPELIILDEPTSALDVSVQAQILNLLKSLQTTYGYGFLFITHNLAVVNHIADHIAVMYLGRIVEFGTKEQIFARPTHPYTQALLKSRIRIDPDSQDIKYVIDGEVPSPINPPAGCHFNPRCVSDARSKECEFEAPHEIKVEENHSIWCVNIPISMEIDTLLETYDDWNEDKGENKLE